MKYLASGIGVLVLIGAGSYFLLEYDDVTTGNVTAELTELKEQPDSVQKPPIVDRGTAALDNKNITQPQRESTIVTDEQLAAAAQQEEKILDMAREYESERSDPQKRQALRDEMTQQLSLYSEAVLPIAMKKMEIAQSPP